MGGWVGYLELAFLAVHVDVAHEVDVEHGRKLGESVVWVGGWVYWLEEVDWTCSLLLRAGGWVGGWVGGLPTECHARRRV